MNPLQPGQTQPFRLSMTVQDGISYDGQVNVSYIFGTLPVGQSIDDIDDALIETYSFNVTVLVMPARMSNRSDTPSSYTATEQVLDGFDAEEPSVENNTHYGALHISSIIRDKDRERFRVSRSFAHKDFQYRIDNPGNTPLTLGRIGNNSQLLAVSFVDQTNWTIVGYALDRVEVTETEFNTAIFMSIKPSPWLFRPCWRTGE